jgi:DnaK suppressor protein
VTTKSATKSTGKAVTAPAVATTAGAVSVTPPAPRSSKQQLPIPPKPGVRYSDKDLNQFKVQIEIAREEALEELRMLRERLEDLTNSETNEESAIYSMHMAEQGSEAIEKEKTYAQIQRIQDYIRKLDEAMQRIHDKTYGICRMCGILIAKERLMAVPITTLSASYKIHQKCPEDGVDRIVAKSPEALR